MEHQSQRRLRVHLRSAQTVAPFSVNHLQEVHVIMIEELIVQETDSVVLDLEKVTLVDSEMVRFFAACEVRSIVRISAANGKYGKSGKLQTRTQRNVPGYSVEPKPNWLLRLDCGQRRNLLFGGNLQDL